MPIKIQNALPARTVLEKENIFIMDENRALTQDIRPLEILILNLMPIKQDTELQLLRALSNTPAGKDGRNEVKIFDGIRWDIYGDYQPAFVPFHHNRR